MGGGSKTDLECCVDTIAARYSISNMKSNREDLILHLADAYIQSDLQCIRVIHFWSVCVFSGN